MAAYKLATTTSFDRDYGKLCADDKVLVDAVIDKLLAGQKLEPKHKDHPLKGRLKGLRDCHVKPDLLLIYELDKNILILTAFRIASHSELF